MATQPLFDDPWSEFEYAARVQLKLTDEWKVKSSATRFRAGVEHLVEALESDRSLCDEERWAALDLNKMPMVDLPQGSFLVTMYREGKRGVEEKAGIVNLNRT